MAFDGNPWAVENGANMSAAVARAAHYAATRGAQGITEPGDLKVTQTSVASQAVEIAAGSATVLNHGADGESYHGLARTPTNVPISVSGSTRHDLIIGRIIDPDFSPWQPSDVPDAVNGPYWEPHVVQGVTSSTTLASDVVGYSAIALARVAVPAAGNITNAMITNLRELAQPRSELQQYTTIPTDDAHLSSDPWVNWPEEANRNVFVPAWATRVVIEVLYSGVRANIGATFGYLRARLGSSGGTSITTLPSGYDVNTPAANNFDRQTYVNADTLTLPSSLRGTLQPFSLEGHRNVTSDTTIQVDGATTVSAKLHFLEGAA